jgi:hypothetical protein
MEGFALSKPAPEGAKKKTLGFRNVRLPQGCSLRLLDEMCEKLDGQLDIAARLLPAFPLHGQITMISNSAECG